ncbi:MAG: methyltransferase domain-containing protein [Candidatus Coatesbacteria bacterium]|nr:methyltransferase domain-containing protein [Candidatus Coatesbacteria bacterium]
MKPQDQVAARVRRFYEEAPFPGIPVEKVSSFNELEARAGIYARCLSKQLLSDARVIDVGCGTGQLLCLLGQGRGRRLIGVDFSLNSLREGMRLASVLGLENVAFVQADIFHLPFASDAFDDALCHGVLHHTAEPSQGLLELARLIREGGFASIGLYNSYGRLLHGFRRWLWRKGLVRRNVSPNGFYRADSEGASEATQRSWFRDQFENPHEVTVSIAQAERWLSDAGFRVLRLFPGPVSNGLKSGVRVFAQEKTRARFGRGLCHFARQLIWMLHPRESGYFIVVGERRGGR